MPLLLADFIYSRDCKLNLRKNVDTTENCMVMFASALKIRTKIASFLH